MATIPSELVWQGNEFHPGKVGSQACSETNPQHRSPCEDCGGAEGALGENEEGCEEGCAGCCRRSSREECHPQRRSPKDCSGQESRLREKKHGAPKKQKHTTRPPPAAPRARR